MLPFWQHLLSAAGKGDPLHRLLHESPETIGPLYEAMMTDSRAQGKFYTPGPLADYLTAQTLGRRLTKAKSRIIKALSRHDTTAARHEVEKIRQLHVADPACGCGIFLTAALRRLHAFYAGLPDELADLRPKAADILSRQLTGVDIDETAVLLAKWSLTRTAARLDSFHSEECAPEVAFLICADALTHPWAWKSVDFILGNPPYLTEVRQQAERFRRFREASPIARYYQAKMDLCDAFVYLGWELLKTDGELGYVLPEYWLQRNSARPLRKHLWDHATLREIHTFGNRKLFKAAPGHHTSLLILSRQMPPETGSASRPCLLGNGDLGTPVAGRIRLDNASGRLLLGASDVMELLEKLALMPPLLAPEDIQQGIVFPQTRLRESEWRRLPDPLRQRVSPNTGIFILTGDECAALDLNVEEVRHLKPCYEPGNFRPFQGFNPDDAPLWLIYADRQLKEAMMARPQDYPALRGHLERFEPVLTSSHKPYGLHRPRQPHWFESPRKILGLRQTFRPAFAVVDTPAYVGEGFYSIVPKNGLPPDFCAGLLNTSLAWFWFYHQKRKGSRLQVDKDVLLAFPAPPELPPKQVRYITALSRRLARTPCKATATALDTAVMTLYKLDAPDRQIVTDFAHRQALPEKQASPCPKAG